LSIRGDSWLIGFWCERGDDFFEAWLTAQRVPEWHQFQYAISDAARWMAGDSQLFACQVFFTNPSSDYRQILDQELPVYCIFFQWKQLNRPPAFAQGLLFPSQGSVDYAKHAQWKGIIWLSLYDFRLLCARSGKSRLRFVVVVCHARNNAFCKCTREINV